MIGLNRIFSEKQVQFRVKRVAQEKLDDDLPCLQLRSQPAEPRLVGIGGCAKGQLLAEFFGQLSLET